MNHNNRYGPQRTNPFFYANSITGQILTRNTVTTSKMGKDRGTEAWRGVEHRFASVEA